MFVTTVLRGTIFTALALIHAPHTGIYRPMHYQTFTYDHRILRTTHPVCSAIFKQDTGGLVVKWVTIGESLLLYVFDILFA